MRRSTGNKIDGDEVEYAGQGVTEQEILWQTHKVGRMLVGRQVSCLITVSLLDRADNKIQIAHTVDTDGKG